MITSTSYESKTVGQLLGEIEKRQIALPRYQRDVVWPLDKKRKLINSVRNGFPIGSLLLAEIDQVNNGVSQKAWRIIDGLQRTSTFQDYISEPQRYIEKSWVDPEWLIIADEICSRATGLHIDEELLRHAILEFMLLGTHQEEIGVAFSQALVWSLEGMSERKRGSGKTVLCLSRKDFSPIG